LRRLPRYVATFVVQVDAVADAAAVMLFDCCYPTVTQLSPNCSPTFPNVPQRSPTFAIKNGDHCGVLILLYVSSLHSRQVQQSARPRSVFKLHHRPLQPRHIVGRLGRLFAVCGRNVFECTSFYSYVNMYPLEESYSSPSKNISLDL
jgi:hypothetical protein